MRSTTHGTGRGAVAPTLVPACSTTRPVNRFGGDSITLRIGTTDGLLRVTSRSYAQQTFVSEFERLSEGRIRIEVVTDVADGQPDAEARWSTGWPTATWMPATRRREGSPRLDRGPGKDRGSFVLTNPQAVEDVLTGEGARLMRTSLEGRGLVALGFAFDGLRIPFASTEPLRSTRGLGGHPLSGTRVPVQADAVRAWAVSRYHSPITGREWCSQASWTASSSPWTATTRTASRHHARGRPERRVVAEGLRFVVNEAFFDGLSSVHQQWLVDAARPPGRPPSPGRVTTTT